METKDTKVFEQAILPKEGIWTVEALGKWLGITNPSVIVQKLTDNGVPILSLSSRPRHKLIRLEDLKKGK